MRCGFTKSTLAGDDVVSHSHDDIKDQTFETDTKSSRVRPKFGYVDF